MTYSSSKRDFFWRRLHSLTGIWLVLFLMEHLLVNSQAALLFGNDGSGFISSANTLEALPFLQVTEMLLLGFPIFIHTVWGIRYIWTAKYNSFPTDGSEPSLPEYSRNRAYTWQRVTSWLIVIGIIAHVIHMRFVERPLASQVNGTHYYKVRVKEDDGLYTLAERLNVKLYTQQQIAKLKEEPAKSKSENSAVQEQLKTQHQQWIENLERKPLRSGELMAVAHDFGTAELLMLRNTFKMPLMLVLYTVFVLATCYHAFNGLWTFLIKWGITLTSRSQLLFLRISTFLMILVSFLGLAAVWGTYWINLRN